MTSLFILTKRNIKLYFKDKGMFFVSLITPVMLLILYITFLGKVYRDAFTQNVPEGLVFDPKLIDGLIAGQLISSILAVCCVTVAFCTNMIMVQDKYTNSLKDLTIAPVKKSVLSLSYFLASLFSTLLVCYFACGLGFIYIAISGWYLTVGDVFLTLLDVFILSSFGTALSSIIHHFLSTQGQVSAVGTIVSSLYGFICGAYMPMSQFPKGLQKALTFLPGTYGTSLIRGHTMNSVMAKLPFPPEVISNIKESIDISVKFFGNTVSIPVMYLILGLSTILLIGIYILINVLHKNRAK